MNISANHETQIFKALSEDIRLRIIVLLTNGELCVCDLMQVLQLPQSSVSRHMAKLKSSYLIQDRRDGKWVYYSINKQINSLIPSLTTTLEEFRSRTPFLQDLEKLRFYKQNKNCNQ